MHSRCIMHPSQRSLTTKSRPPNYTGKPSMASLQYSQFLLIFTVLCFSQASHLPSLLSLNCTHSSQNPLITDKPIQVFLDNLTSQVTKARFITSTIDLGLAQLDSLMQCRLDLNPDECTLCAQNARLTISSICPNANAVAAWFDGCYLQYYYYQNHGSSSRAYLETTNWSCSNQTNVVDRVQFESALETLLLRLRADIYLTSHHGFSSGEFQYGNVNRIYGLLECVRSVSSKDCEVCVGKGIEMLYEHCGGKEGGAVVAGCCVVRYERYRFFSRVWTGIGTGSGNGSDDYVKNWESANGGSVGCKGGVALVWGLGAAFVIVIVLSCWALRRTIVNTAKVDDRDEGGSKGNVRDGTE